MAFARGSVAAASGQLQNKRVARWNDLFTFAFEGLAAAKVDPARGARTTALAAAGRMVDPVEEREDGKGIITGVGDFDNLAEAAPELPGAARIRPVFLAFKYERGEGFGDLHRRIAHPRREGSRG